MKASLYRNPLAKGVVRNVICPCGSGKKVKKCHGQKYAISQDEIEEIKLIASNSRRSKDESTKV